jgi:hypothetical protein
MQYGNLPQWTTALGAVPYNVPLTGMGAHLARCVLYIARYTTRASLS